jgi:hypothetical protein
LFISFARPKEMNQRKGRPQIFFGINILSAAHAIQLAPPLLAGSLKQYCLLVPYSSQPTKCQSLSKKDLKGIARLTAICVVLNNLNSEFY